MKIHIPSLLLDQIQSHGENAYPYEGAALMLGGEEDGERTVESLLFLENAREEENQHNRYLITAEDMLSGEKEADRLSLSILGIFHSTRITQIVLRSMIANLQSHGIPT